MYRCKRISAIPQVSNHISTHHRIPFNWIITDAKIIAIIYLIDNFHIHLRRLIGKQAGEPGSYESSAIIIWLVDRETCRRRRRLRWKGQFVLFAEIIGTQQYATRSPPSYMWLRDSATHDATSRASNIYMQYKSILLSHIHLISESQPFFCCPNIHRYW